MCMKRGLYMKLDGYELITVEADRYLRAQCNFLYFLICLKFFIIKC